MYLFYLVYARGLKIIVAVANTALIFCSLSLCIPDLFHCLSSYAFEDVPFLKLFRITQVIVWR